MSEEHFDLFLTGALAEGSSRDKALQQLGALFKREPAEVVGLLAGKPTRIRKNLSPAELQKYQAAFDRLGILTEAIPCLDSIAPSIRSNPVPKNKVENNSAISRNAAAAASLPLALEPVGSPVLRDNERRKVSTRQVDTSGLSLTALHQSYDSAPATQAARTPRTDHLSLAQAGSDLRDGAKPKVLRGIDELSGNFTIAAPGTDLLDQPRERVTAKVPDTRHLRAE